MGMGIFTQTTEILNTSAAPPQDAPRESLGIKVVCRRRLFIRSVGPRLDGLDEPTLLWLRDLKSLMDHVDARAILL